MCNQSKCKDVVSEDMERLSPEDFYLMYCVDGDDGCDECDRNGACCLICKHRLSCNGHCNSEKQRREMEKEPTEKFYCKLADHDESLIVFVAADRLKNAERERDALRQQLRPRIRR